MNEDEMRYVRKLEAERDGLRRTLRMIGAAIETTLHPATWEVPEVSTEASRNDPFMVAPFFRRLEAVERQQRRVG